MRQIYFFNSNDGLTVSGEEIWQAAIREVREETGVQAEFVCIACLRHLQSYAWGCADIYVVCLMKAKTTEINMCTNEIAECRWMDVSNHVPVHPPKKLKIFSLIHLK